MTVETQSDPLYLYAVLRQVTPGLDACLADLKGATMGAPHRRDVAGRSVIVGAHDGSEILRTRRRMLAHTRVLERAMALAPLLPMRFGHVAETHVALEALISAHSEAIDAQFDRLSDHVEVGLRVSFPRQAALETLLSEDHMLASERDRLAGRGAEAHFDRIELGRQVAEALDRRRTSAQHRLIAGLSEHCAHHILKAPEDDVEILRTECLVAPSQVGRLAEEADALARASGFAPGAEPEVRLVGPVPPYHFVDLSLTAPEATVWA